MIPVHRHSIFWKEISKQHRYAARPAKAGAYQGTTISGAGRLWRGPVVTRAGCDAGRLGRGPVGTRAGCEAGRLRRGPVMAWTGCGADRLWRGPVGRLVGAGFSRPRARSAGFPGYLTNRTSGVL